MNPSDSALPVPGNSAVVVVWYAPDQPAMERLSIYSRMFDHVYVVDNSPIPTPATFPRNVSYAWLGRNRGIAAALNHGARFAIRDGYLWLLTMDQDSSFSKHEIGKLFVDAARILQDPPAGVDVGIIAAIASLEPPTDRSVWRLLPHVLTSGNLVSVSAIAHVGGWDDGLFIDHVDHEFCFRLREHGYSVVVTHAAWLGHKPGQAISRYGRTRRVHSPRRYFFMTRNLVTLSVRYGSKFSRDVRRLWFFHAKNTFRSVLRGPHPGALLFAVVMGLFSGAIRLLTGHRRDSYGFD